ncbi:hypothetical protein IQ06DRAFT_323617 [Phaeosphaeriaceae sp. SRC1lsM3a]|nr:hypothetical protein IQ06DRAFT_323617 [Stagonospora sp. SRC1lsM3a]
MFSLLTRLTSTPPKKELGSQPSQRLPPTIHSEQLQSIFFTLAAEIRNEVYRYVFDSDFREQLSVESHPLSLLLQAGYRTANILANSILLFPNLRRFEIRILRGTRSSSWSHHSWSHDSHVENDLHACAVHKYAPPWFAYTILRSISAGWVHSWQEGQHWNIEWPQLKDWSYFDVHEKCNTAGDMFLVPSMQLEAIGHVRGVHLCSRECGQVNWLSADLVRETGRRVAVDAIYYGLEDRPTPDLSMDFLLKMRLGHKAVILKEGTAPVTPEAQSHDRSAPASGFTYEPGAMYWDNLGVRNGDWKAKCRVAWNSITGVYAKEEVSGSMALNEGDWARMTDRKGATDIFTTELGLARSSPDSK